MSGNVIGYKDRETLNIWIFFSLWHRHKYVIARHLAVMVGPGTTAVEDLYKPQTHLLLNASSQVKPAGKIAQLASHTQHSSVPKGER